MKHGDRYDASGLEEARSEPGSGGRVLKNLLGIKKKREMDRVEAREQLRALEELTALYDQHHFAESTEFGSGRSTVGRAGIDR